MREDFLHFIWQHRLYDVRALQTLEGDEVVVHDTGKLNRSSGPDFQEARVSIADTQWVGAVEIHLRSSDWYAHGHETDPAYDNVILHVVYEHDREVYTARGVRLLTIVLRGRIERQRLERYALLREADRRLPCGEFIGEVQPIVWHNWLDRVLVERLERKTKDVALLLKHQGGDWLQAFYALLGGYLGGNWNKLSMFELARRVPWNIVGYYKDDDLKRESLLLGAAGFLERGELEKEAEPWQREWEHLRRKHSISVSRLEWKTGRIRPDNAPVNRIVQWSGCIPYLEDTFDRLMQTGHVHWSDFPLLTSNYWKEHRNFGQRKRQPSERLTNSMSDLLSINVHAPLLHHFGDISGDVSLCETALEGLHLVKPESNRIIKYWQEWVAPPENAARSQALIELHSQYCTPKKCVICNVGKTVISKA